MTREEAVDLDAVVAGSLPEIRRWLEQIAPRLYVWAGTRMSPELRRLHDPEDATQEILAALYRDLPRIGPAAPEELNAWMFTVAENRIRDLAKAASRQKRSGTPRPAPRVSTPSSIVSRREELDLMMDALDRLSDEQRAVIRLRRFEGLTSSETATRMGRSDDAVRALHHRATRALSALLHPDPPAPSSAG